MSGYIILIYTNMDLYFLNVLSELLDRINIIRIDNLTFVFYEVPTYCVKNIL